MENVKDKVMNIIGRKEEYLKEMLVKADEAGHFGERDFWAGRLLEAQQISDTIYNELPDE